MEKERHYSLPKNREAGTFAQSQPLHSGELRSYRYRIGIMREKNCLIKRRNSRVFSGNK
jgi:hypothetical protein